MTEELRNAARAIIAQVGSQKEVMALLNEESNNLLAEAEAAKSHPLKTLLLSDADWAALKAHLMDGGGVNDHRQPLGSGPSLRDTVWQAVLDGNQAAFWAHLPHLFKAHAKAEGLIRPLAAGGSSIGPIGSSHIPAKEPGATRKVG